MRYDTVLGRFCRFGLEMCWNPEGWTLVLEETLLDALQAPTRLAHAPPARCAKETKIDLHEAKEALNSVVVEPHRIEATLPNMAEHGDPQRVQALDKPLESSTDAKTAIVADAEAASNLLREPPTDLKSSLWGAIEADVLPLEPGHLAATSRKPS